MKTFETRKLLYNKFLYKIVFYNSLAIIFTKAWNRNNFSYARKELDKLTSNYDAGIPLQRSSHLFIPIDISDYKNALSLLDLLKEQPRDSYTLRSERYQISIASNDTKFLNKLKNKLDITEFWKPAEDSVEMLQNNERICLVKRDTDFLYRVYLKAGRTPGIGKFLEKYPTKIKVGKKSLTKLKNNQLHVGLYFYVKDDNTLFLLQIPYIKHIQKVEKLVYKCNIDK